MLIAINIIDFEYKGFKAVEGFKGFNGFTGFVLTSLLIFMMQ